MGGSITMSWRAAETPAHCPHASWRTCYWVGPRLRGYRGQGAHEGGEAERCLRWDDPAFPIAPVNRLPFPERGYVVGVPEAAALDARSIVVRENGLRVEGLRVDPLESSGLRFGVVLALDASNSMAGAPAVAALESARAFVPFWSSPAF